MTKDSVHIVVDLETLGIRPTSAFISIGAVACTSHGDIGSRFYCVVNSWDLLRKGFTTDQSTIDWWDKQCPDAREVLEISESHHDLSLSVKEALSSFSNWIGEMDMQYSPVGESVYVWGNGANFDNAILENAYHTMGMTVPWKYTHARCFRTLRDTFPTVDAPSFEGTKHNALADAQNEAGHLVKLLQAREAAINFLTEAKQ